MRPEGERRLLSPERLLAVMLGSAIIAAGAMAVSLFVAGRLAGIGINALRDATREEQRLERADEQVKELLLPLSNKGHWNTWGLGWFVKLCGDAGGVYDPRRKACVLKGGVLPWAPPFPEGAAKQGR